MRWARVRALVSVMPPAAKGTIQVTERAGKDCAAARPGSSTGAASKARRVGWDMAWPPRAVFPKPSEADARRRGD